MRQDFFCNLASHWGGFLMVVLVVILLHSCGTYEEADVAASGDTGSVVFSVKWVPPPETSGLQALEEQFAEPLADENVCEKYTISQVNLEVKRANGSETGVKKTEPCSSHTATLEGVPADVELYVELTTDPPGWGGQSGRFTLASGEEKPLGEIVVVDLVPPQWYPAEQLSTSVYVENTSGPVVAMDASGDAIAVWINEECEVYAHHFTRLGGWGPERMIGFIGPSGGRLSEPSIVMNPNGDAIVVWLQYHEINSIYSIYMSRFTKEDDWGEFRPITSVSYEPGVGFWFGDFRIAIDDSGNAILVYDVNGNFGEGDTFARRYMPPPADEWGVETPIENNEERRSDYPQIAMNGSGNAIVVYKVYDDDASVYNLFARHYTVSADTWGGETPIENIAESIGHPEIAMDESGNTIVLFRTVLTFASLYSVSTGTWDTDIPIEGMNGAPRVAMNGSGNAIATWKQGEDLFANRYTLSGGWEGERIIAVGENWENEIYSPAIAMDASGTAIVAYSRVVESYNGDLYVRMYTWSTDTWGAETLLEEMNPGYAGGADIGMDGRGNAVLVWFYHFYDSDYIIPYANHYD